MLVCVLFINLVGRLVTIQMQRIQTEQILLNGGKKESNESERLARDGIRNILMNKARLLEDPLTEKIFETDLVMKMKISNESYKDWSEKVELGQIIKKPPKAFLDAYEGAFAKLHQDMEQKGDSIDKNQKKSIMRYLASIVPLKLNNSSKACKKMKQLYNIAHVNNATKPKVRQINLHDQIKDQLVIQCHEEYVDEIDAFTIQYNALIYTLQNICGFKTKSFMVSDEISILKENKNKKFMMKNANNAIERSIYILLYLPDNNLAKAANKFQIQKEIDYKQIDPFLNEPRDSSNRPLKFNSQIESKQDLSAIYQIISAIVLSFPSQQGDEQDSSHQLNRNPMARLKIDQVSNNSKNYLYKDFMKRKTCERKLGFLMKDYNSNVEIINQVQLNEAEIDRYMEFDGIMKDNLFSLLYHEEKQGQIVSNFHEIEEFQEGQFVDPDALTLEEKQYLYRVNRGKWNPGVQKKLLQVKKQRRHFDMMKETSERFGYSTYSEPIFFAPFYLASKKQKFFEKLSHTLMYKQQVTTPFGDLALFNKMERIKLSYLVMRHYMRVENLSKLNINMFALQNDFQKEGVVGNEKSTTYHSYHEGEGKKVREDIKGGLDGRNLTSSWHHLFLWNNHKKTIRGYLGEEKAFQVFIKTFLIFLFMFIGPFGALAEFIKREFIRKSKGYTAQFAFNITYLLIVVIVYGIFMEKYKNMEKVFQENYTDRNPMIEFLREYKGPYTRDIFTDSANDYDETYSSWKDKIKRAGGQFIILLCLGVIIGFYYLMRNWIVTLSQVIQVDSQSFYLFRGVHLIVYSIFFTVNMALQKVVIPPFATWLTKYENWPTHRGFASSVDSKLYLFAIGVELIGPIDLVYIQYTTKSECLSSWCYKELEAYVYSRYFIMMGYVILSALRILVKFIRSRTDQITKLFVREEVQGLNFESKLGKFLLFIYRESEKQDCADILLIDETVALVHFCTFVTVFPLAPAISFFSILISYNVERRRMLSSTKRPIPKSKPFSSYSKNMAILSHWLIFYNISQMFITLDWLEYMFPDVLLAILSPDVISPSTIMMVRYFTILLFFLAYEIILQAARKLTRFTVSFMDVRQRVIYQNYVMSNKFSSQANLKLQIPNPILTVSRTHFDDTYLQGDDDKSEDSFDENEVLNFLIKGVAAEQPNGNVLFQNSGNKIKD